jgi:hypothetical protein
MPLREYLYIDEKRLDSYAEQIGSPVTFDKTPVWKVMFGLTGPSVEGQQQRPGRARSTTEKIDLLMKYLEKQKNVDLDEENPFSFGTYRAVKVILPINEDKLALWVSEHDYEAPRSSYSSRRLLFLIQDDGINEDTRPGHFSNYSALMAFFEEAPKLGSIKSLPRGLVENPIEALRNLGAAVSESRNIQTLYRIRKTHADHSVPGLDGEVRWAYPIFIAAL